MNKAELVDVISGKTKLSKKDVASVIDAMQKSIMETLAKGGKVALVGFGTFKVSKRKARIGLNPRTKEPIKIAACTAPKFVAGKALKEKVR
ncbi:MAG: DNA-binding protein [Actinobacteria bacterium RBG_19FT_COMBO_36_27]|nr:MAG: DNA-binding protein [Actinobacteria bacterium RBG_19FT_COMBO_36_27]